MDAPQFTYQFDKRENFPSKVLFNGVWEELGCPRPVAQAIRNRHGLIRVVNAPRPLPCDRMSGLNGDFLLEWRGPFMHGIFYAASVHKDIQEEQDRLDAWEVTQCNNADVMDLLDRRSRLEYQIPLSQLLEENPHMKPADMASMWRYPALRGENVKKDGPLVVRL